jgi:hypothetical protein
MNELRIPTIAIAAHADYSGGVLSGTIFLPTLAAHHDGPTRPEEWLNQGEQPFFPFLPEGQNRAIILNKERLRVLTIRLAAEIDIQAEDRPFAVPVTVECGDRSLRGLLVIELPSGHARLLDYMNTRELFVPLWTEDALHLIRKSCITRISEDEGV